MDNQYFEIKCSACGNKMLIPFNQAVVDIKDNISLNTTEDGGQILIQCEECKNATIINL